MDFKQIQELIKLVNDSNIGEVTLEQKDFKSTMRQKEEQITQVMSAPMQAAPAYHALPQQAAPAQLAASAQAPASGGAAPVSAPANTVTIKSPMIGTFYRRP